MQIALFGTSADPPTLGHQVVVEWLAQNYDRVAVWASDNPFKGNQTPLVHRQRMLGLLVDRIQAAYAHVIHYPQLSEAKTLRTVQRAYEWWPMARLTLVVGSDVLPTLLHWYKVDVLLQLIEILVLPRSGAPLLDHALVALRERGGRVAIANFMGPDISSSSYRHTGNAEGLPQAIATYIQTHNLYNSPRATSLPPNLASDKNVELQPIPAPLADFKVGVDNVIFSIDTTHNQLLVLLAVRQQEPYQGRWALPGTLVRHQESLEDAAYRILAEKIHVQNLYLEQLYTFGDFHRDTHDGTEATRRYLSISYFAVVRYQEALLMSDERHLLAWHSLQQLPPLAFDHSEILSYGHQRLCNKLEYSPIAFDVLPDQFTLRDLYHLYCTVLGEQFSDYSNFRARLLKLKFLTDTGKKTSQGAGRPATLYCFNAEAFSALQDQPLVFI